MRKIIIIGISILLVLFISICIMIGIDNKYINNMEKDIIKNTGIKDIAYVNKYDENYIVLDNEYLYLFNSDYEEIYKIKNSLLYDNKNNYDIIYKDDTIMYMENYKNKEGIIFKYYDIYTYEVIEKIVVGDN